MRMHVSEAGVPIRCAQEACWLQEEALGCCSPFPTKDQRTSPRSYRRAHTGCGSQCGPFPAQLQKGPHWLPQPRPHSHLAGTEPRPQVPPPESRAGYYQRGCGPASQAPRCREAIRVATGRACCAPCAGPAAGATDAETQARGHRPPVTLTLCPLELAHSSEHRCTHTTLSLHGTQTRCT